MVVLVGLLSFREGAWNAAVEADAAEKLDLKEAKEFEEDEMENEMELEAAEGPADREPAANEFEAKEFGDATDDLDVNEVTEDGNLNDDVRVRLVCT